MHEPPISELAAKDAIRTVLHRYCRAIDRCDAELLAGVYHEGAVVDHGEPGLASDFQRHVFTQLRASWTATQHLIGNVLIELDGDTAFSEAYFIAHHVTRTPAGQLPTLVALGGRYVDRFERRDGAWRIADRVLVKDWQETRPYADVRPKAFQRQRPDRLDPSYRPDRAPADIERSDPAPG
jgi:ketosteroid isomerase-like protein